MAMWLIEGDLETFRNPNRNSPSHQETEYICTTTGEVAFVWEDYLGEDLWRHGKNTWNSYKSKYALLNSIVKYSLHDKDQMLCHDFDEDETAELFSFVESYKYIPLKSGKAFLFVKRLDPYSSYRFGISKFKNGYMVRGSSPKYSLIKSLDEFPGLFRSMLWNEVSNDARK